MTRTEQLRKEIEEIGNSISALAEVRYKYRQELATLLIAEQKVKNGKR